MAFGSIEFLFYFLPILWFTTGYIRFKKLLFLILSLFFYTWGEGIYVILLIGIVYINFLITKLFKFNKYKNLLLVIILLFNIALLIYFKYLGFLKAVILNNFHGASRYDGSSDIHLPIGISFFVFQIISYSVDRYRGKIGEGEKFADVLIYISMFPHQLAGPIVRFLDIKKYLDKINITTKSFVVGLNIFIIGLSQKILLADTFAEIADEIFAIPILELSSTNAWIGAIAYTFQIFFDFQGYSIMAAGLAIQFGIFFPRNFSWPYSSQSITEFWRSWHITLSQWFRDYVYIPMGGNRFGNIRTATNLLTVFVLCGLWHGANLTFMIWGLYHGIFLSIERLLKRFARLQIPRPIKHIYTLLVVIVGWVIFRSINILNAREYIKTMFNIDKLFNDAYPIEKYLRIDYFITFIIAILLSTPYPYRLFNKYIKWPESDDDINYLFINSSFFINLIYYGLLTICIINIIAVKHKPFIYFRF
jgi:alginate O-acetyltransferase complex protein AlgI